MSDQRSYRTSQGVILAGSKPIAHQQERINALLEISKALKAISFYPKDHPQLLNALSHAVDNIKPVLQAVGEMAFDVSSKGFFFHGRQMGESHQVLRELALEMHLRQIKKFAMRRDLSPSEFEAFLRMLVLDPSNFRSGAYIEEYFKSNMIKGIWVNEIQFDKAFAFAQKGLEQAAGLEEEDIEDLDPESEEYQRALKVNELISMLEKEKDPEKFMQVCRELEVICAQLIRDKDMKRAWNILGVLSDLADTYMAAGEEVLGQHAYRSVRALSNDNMLTYLLEQYLSLPAEFRNPYLRLFRQSREKIVAPVTNILSRNEVLYSYRSLMDLLIQAGPEVRGPLASMLNDSRVFLVRKICFIIGERRERESTSSLAPLLDHPDIRIRKETIRALSKIRGPQVSRIFINKINKKTDTETLSSIVQALGEMKDYNSVPALVSQFKTKKSDIELLENIAEVLGKIGSKEALPFLVKALDKKGLFNRERRMGLRVKAALALGQIGGESAVSSLRRNLSGSGDELDQACRQALQALNEKGTV